MNKKARVITKNRKGHHPQGGPQNATMELRAGAKGTGRKLQIVRFWPWSATSVAKADEIMAEAAVAEGYEIICGCTNPEPGFSEDGLLEWCHNCGKLICDHHQRKFGSPHPG